MIFFFDGSLRNRNIEMQPTVNQVDGPASGMSTNSKAGPSTGVGQLTQSQNGGFPLGKTPNRDIARDTMSRGRQQDESITVSGAQPSVDFPGVATAESGLIDRQSFNSSDGVLPVTTSNLKGHEGRTTEKRATLSMAGKNSAREVKEGENLSQITMETYGSKNVKYLEWVKQHNPQIVNPDFILPGQKVVLPEYRKNEASQ
jgi:nucleoid-associated protein YgaU